MVKCPTCEGEGIIECFHVIYRNKPNEFNKMLPCFRCEGRKTIPDEQLEWIKDGNRIKDHRRNLGIGIRKMAQIINIEAYELSRMEHGYAQPDEEIYQKILSMQGE